MKKIQKCGKKPTDDKKATFYSDGNDQYTNALFKCFDTNTINYGQLIKERENGRVIGKTKKIVFGSLYPEDIDTVHIERYNLTMRLDMLFKIFYSQFYKYQEHQLIRIAPRPKGST